MSLDIAGRRATKVAKVGTDVLWWMALLFAAIIGTLFLLSPVLLESGVNEMAVQVSVAEGNAPRMQPLAAPNTHWASQVVLEERDLTHHLAFRTTEWRMFLMVSWVFLPAIAALIAGIHLLRAFLADVLAADVFTRRNAERLSKLGWLVIVVAILSPPLQYWRSWIVLRRMELDTAGLSPAKPELIDGSIIVGVLLLILASAWRYGVELQRERDLTV